MEDQDKNVQATIYTTKAQRQEWYDEAEEMGMSKKEYLNSMVNAGRREFGLADLDSETDNDTTAPKTGQSVIDELGLRGRVLDVLHGRREEAKDFDEVTKEVIGDIEEDISDILATDDRIEHRPTDGYWKK